jgi:hypothetical protein
MSTSSSAIPEKVLAVANNQRLIVNKVGGLFAALISSHKGGRLLTEFQAESLEMAMKTACLIWQTKDERRLSVVGPELLAQAMGVRLHLIKLSGARSNIGPPVDSFFGPESGPSVKIIALELKGRSLIEYFSFVGPSFNNDNLNSLEFGELLSLLGKGVADQSFMQGNSAQTSSLSATDQRSVHSDEGNGHGNSSPSTPVRLTSIASPGSASKESVSDSTLSSLMAAAFSTAKPEYLMGFSSAAVKAWRQVMSMHPWPNPFHKYVHNSIVDYVRGQWDVYVDAGHSTPYFNDSASLDRESWFDTLEAIVAEAKNDEDGVTLPSLQVSRSNGLPIAALGGHT